MGARKPRIEYYWTPGRPGSDKHGAEVVDHFVNWRLIGANGEVMCQSTQGYRDKRDARRAVEAVTLILCKPAHSSEGAVTYGVREVGPGRKPE
jgi:hypothetical protein